LNIATRLIRGTEGNLSEIFLGNTLYGEGSREYVRAIYEHCPKIRILSLGFNHHVAAEFETLLRRCQQLQKLVTHGIDDDYGIEIFDSSLLLDLLMRFAPKSLREIRFQFTKRQKILAGQFVTFFENWRGRVPLDFFVFYHNATSITKTHILIIQKFINEGVIENSNVSSYLQ